MRHQSTGATRGLGPFFTKWKNLAHTCFTKAALSKCPGWWQDGETLIPRRKDNAKTMHQTISDQDDCCLMGFGPSWCYDLPGTGWWQDDEIWRPKEQDDAKTMQQIVANRDQDDDSLDYTPSWCYGFQAQDDARMARYGYKWSRMMRRTWIKL